MASAKQLKHVILKNLAALLAEADDSAMRALQLYGEALLLDDGDAVVWNRMGTLVSALSLHALETTHLIKCTTARGMPCCIQISSREHPCIGEMPSMKHGSPGTLSIVDLCPCHDRGSLEACCCHDLYCLWQPLCEC